MAGIVNIDIAIADIIVSDIRISDIIITAIAITNITPRACHASSTNQAQACGISRCRQTALSV